MSHYWTILLLLVSCLTSCLLELCLSRVRASMCDLFYPDKAEERADYVHYRLSAGRINRKTKLMLLIRRELDRRRNLVAFSPRVRLLGHVPSVRRSFRCPGCKWRVSDGESVCVRFSILEKDEDETECVICKNCYLDFPEDPQSFI